MTWRMWVIWGRRAADRFDLEDVGPGEKGGGRGKRGGGEDRFDLEDVGNILMWGARGDAGMWQGGGQIGASASEFI